MIIRVKAGALTLLAIAIALVAMATAAKASAPEELAALRRGDPGEAPGGDDGGALRERALREAALSSSIQAGARWRYGRILEGVVRPREKLLDDLFDFGPLVTQSGRLTLIPPVAASAGEAIRLSDSRTALGQDESYSLIGKARLSGVRPDWRHYLMAAPQAAPPPHKSLRPKGARELRLWKGEVDRGWALGLAQADRLFASNVARLARDYAGMMVYKRLVIGRYARETGTQETVTDLEVGEGEIVFRKTLYELVGQDGFVAPPGHGNPKAPNGRPRKEKR
jgi:defect-in-organelle-trafficking protein DotC